MMRKNRARGRGKDPKKGRPLNSRPALKKCNRGGLDLGLGFFQANHPVAFFPLAALFEQLNPLEPLEDVTFHDEAAWTLETFVLGHGGLDKMDAWNASKGKQGRVRLCP